MYYISLILFSANFG